MSDDVAAVQKALTGCDRTDCFVHRYKCAGTLAALTAAGIACVHVPEGVEVEHGARLVALGDEWCGRPVLGIEAARYDEPICICFTVRDDKGNPSVEYIGCPVHLEGGVLTLGEPHALTPEERKAIAMSAGMHGAPMELVGGICDEYYPKCCEYHKGFDAALATPGLRWWGR